MRESLFGERCPTTALGEEDLRSTMNNKLFGQHIVLKTVPNVVKQHKDEG